MNRTSNRATLYSGYSGRRSGRRTSLAGGIAFSLACDAMSANRSRLEHFQVSRLMLAGSPAGRHSIFGMIQDDLNPEPRRPFSTHRRFWSGDRRRILTRWTVKLVLLGCRLAHCACAAPRSVTPRSTMSACQKPALCKLIRQLSNANSRRHSSEWRLA